MDDASRRSLNNRLLLVILFGAAWLRLLHIDQPFVDLASWRETDDAIIADNFFRGHYNIFLPEVSWNGPGPNYVGYEFQLTTYLAALLYRVFGQADWVGRGVSVAFGAPRQISVVAVLGYRLVNFWLPLPVGLAAYITSRAKPEPVDAA